MILTEIKAKGYSDAGASHERRALRGFTARSGSPNEDINWNNYTLRQRGRMLYMSAPVATSAINTNRAKVVGLGLTLKSSVDRDVLGLSPESAKEWQRHTEKEFRLWADRKQNCDATGVNSFDEIQQLVLSSWLMSGDVFALFKRYKPTPSNPYSLRLHIIEADRVGTPNVYGGAPYPFMTDGKNTSNGNRIFDGVEVDKNGMVTAYHIRNTYPWQVTAEPTVWTRVKAYGDAGLPNILHIMSSERPDQYRGVSYLAPVIEPLLQLRRYTESEMVAALIQTFFTAFITTETDPGAIPMNEVGAGDVYSGASPHDNISKSENEYEMAPGMINHLKPGESVTFSNPNIPTTTFGDFVKAFCQIIGAGLNLPYDVLIKEYNSSYSASRGALMDAWDEFRMRRSWLVSDFCQPVYETWLAEAVARGRVKAPGFWNDPLVRAAWSGARWIGPIQGSLDPLKEAKAAVLQIQNALKTHEQAAREMGGGDWDENVEQIKAENEKLAEATAGTEPVNIDLTKEDDET